MLKKYSSSLLLIALIIVNVFALGVFLPVKAVEAESQTMTISQFVELLITIGVVPADRIASARAMASQISSTTPVVPATVLPTVSTSTAYIQVLTPNGAESWDIDLDVPYSITWGSAGLTQARVALVNSKNVACDLSPNPVASKNGNHEYKFLLKTAKCYNLTTGSSTPLTDGTYKARVYYTDGAKVTIKDESNAVFKILPVPIPSLKLTYPNGGESLVRNTEYAVKYTLTNVDESRDDLIYYYLLDNNGNTANNGHALMRGGTFDYDLPSSLSAGAYKIKLKLTTDERVDLEDTSDNFFWISTGL